MLAIAQMGVHLVFFLHITTGPDNTNNVLALAFGVLIVFLVVAGSLWIMTNLNDNMMPHVRADEFADAALTHRQKLMIAAWEAFCATTYRLTANRCKRLFPVTVTSRR